MVLSSLRFLCNMVLLILGIVLQQSFTNAFLPSPGSISDMPPSRIIPRSVATHCDDIALLRMSDGDDNNYDGKSRLSDLGYSNDEIKRSMRKPVKKAERKVRIDLVENVDPATLTAVGFGLIAFNFFVLANMGDGGIGGIVATIINSF
jgi:hypothetical protein